MKLSYEVLMLFMAAIPAFLALIQIFRISSRYIKLVKAFFVNKNVSDSALDKEQAQADEGFFNDAPKLAIVLSYMVILLIATLLLLNTRIEMKRLQYDLAEKNAQISAMSEAVEDLKIKYTELMIGKELNN